MSAKQHEAATVIALKRGCGQAEADRTAASLTDEQCDRIIASRDAFAGGQLVEAVLAERPKPEAAIEPAAAAKDEGRDEPA